MRPNLTTGSTLTNPRAEKTLCRGEFLRFQPHRPQAPFEHLNRLRAMDGTDLATRVCECEEVITSMCHRTSVHLELELPSGTGKQRVDRVWM
jgi:hypothetical protein